MNYRVYAPNHEMFFTHEQAAMEHAFNWCKRSGHLTRVVTHPAKAFVCKYFMGKIDGTIFKDTSDSNDND